jgi:hypothetical protein
MATLYNKGKRTWKLEKDLKELKPGKRIDVDKKLAEKYIGLYPKEFELMDSIEQKAEPKKKPRKKREEPETVNTEDIEVKLEEE